MRVGRFLRGSLVCLVALVFCVPPVSGCGGGSSSGEPIMVADAGPLLPEQKKTFDQFYKAKKASMQSNAKRR